MKLFHDQFVIEIFEKNGKFIAMAEKPYECGCTSSEHSNVVNAIYDVIRRADHFDDNLIARWLVHYADGRYDDFKEFTDEDAAWAFYASMNKDPGCWASEPELEDLPF